VRGFFLLWGALGAAVKVMKMEHALAAPHAAFVRDLVVSVGDQVKMGERIMRVEAGSVS
jgi:biotin carboxyl carrier protein